MEAFFKTHKYLVEHLYSPVRRGLMDEIDWNDRLIGIKGSRGVGKTTFLLDYAREHFGADNKECLYINLNHFYFTERTLVDFASEFRAKGGKVLLIDQVFKYSGWSKELRYCYDNFTDLKIIFSGSSVMRKYFLGASSMKSSRSIHNSRLNSIKWLPASGSSGLLMASNSSTCPSG